MPFIPSLELSRMLYQEQIEPIMEARFPDLPYAAATFGMCSEILGLDDEVSMDHEWGPRIRILLSEDDHTRRSDDIRSVLRESLPTQFKGFDMMWRKPGVDIHGTRETILYHVSVGTVTGALGFCGGLDALPLSDVDWLRVSEQHLLDFTSGVVYRDDVGELTRARDSLRYYPDSVLRFLLMCEWYAVNGDWFPIGRIGSRGDRLGLRIQAARVAHHLVRIAFMVSRQYAPYTKWFGTLFSALPIARTLEPVLLELTAKEEWQQIEEAIGRAASILVQAQNGLDLASPIALGAETVDDGRHHVKLGLGDIGRALAAHVQPPLRSVTENQVFWLHERSLILWNQEVGKWSLLLQQ
jgi:hypothetical protein